MKNNNFWFWSLVALIIISNATDLGVFGRVALIANALVVLLGVVRSAVRIYKQRRR